MIHRPEIWETTGMVADWLWNANRSGLRGLDAGFVYLSSASAAISRTIFAILCMAPVQAHGIKIATHRTVSCDATPYHTRGY